MKKTFLTLMVLAASMQAWAQAENGAPVSTGNSEFESTLTIIPKVGLNYSTTSLNSWASKSIGLNKPDISGLVGVAAGVEVEYTVNPWLGLSGALLYSMQGRKYDDVAVHEQAVRDGLMTSASAKSAMISKEYHHYFNLPLTANFYIIDRLALRTGIQFGILFHQSGTLESPLDDFPKHSINGSPGKFDLSIPVGVSYALENGLQFDLRYNHGLTTLSWSDGIREEKNRVVQLTVGYRVDMTKIKSLFKHKN